MPKALLSYICLVFSVVFLTSTSARAYLDAGTGSLLVQALIGAFAVASAVVARFWYRLKSLVNRPVRGKAGGHQ